MKLQKRKEFRPAFFMPRLHLRFKVTMPETGILVHEHWEEGHSWTRNAWNGWNMMMMDCSASGIAEFRSGVLSSRAYGSNTLVSGTSNFAVRGNDGIFSGYGFYNNAADASFGILVGTDDSEFCSDDYCLYSLIAHGNGAGQFAYTSQGAPVTVYNSGDDTWSTTHKRIFNNNSGSEITVKETGLGYRGASMLNYYPLMARDVLDTPVAVPNGAQLTVEYTITTQAFTACEASAVQLPALGAEEASGGYYIGRYTGWGHPNHIWLLIASPIGGEIAAGKWSDPAQSSGFADIYYGFDGTEALIALGAVSPLGQAVAAYRTATGVSSWYIPARYEALYGLYPLKDYMPAGHEFSSINHWTATRNSTSAYVCNISTGAEAATGQTSSAPKCRLIRRIKWGDFVPVSSTTTTTLP